MADGRRQFIYLGRYGSTDSKAPYERILAELRTGTPQPDLKSSGQSTPSEGLKPRLLTARAADPTVNEVLLAFWVHAKAHYRRADGTPTQEVSEYRQSLRVVRELYEHTLAAEFGPLALKAVRQRYVNLG